MQVTVIDYKAGNLTSVVKALRHLGAEVTVTESSQDVAEAQRIVLPGVGHFAATARLDDTGLTPAIREAITRGVPFLGICVGMQWLLEGSSEAPNQPGLGYFHAHCERFPEGKEKVPHVGWNTILPHTDPEGQSTRLMSGIQAAGGDNFAYFTHSYYVPAGVVFRAPATPAKEPIAAVTRYINVFASAVEHRNVFGVQFHPEKSGETGLKILKNFLEISA